MDKRSTYMLKVNELFHGYLEQPRKLKIDGEIWFS